MEWDSMREGDVEGLPVYDVQGREVGAVVHWERRAGGDTARFDVAVPGLPSPMRLDLESDDVQFHGDGVHLNRSLEALARGADVPLDDAVRDRLSEDTAHRGGGPPP